jgi:ketosteroid isomerase-like protein
MYKLIAGRQARKVFQNLSSGDYPAAMRGIADDVHHVFPGNHPLGGARHSRAAMERWFERLYRLYPELDFEVKRVAVKGSPWDLWIAVEWADRGRAADGVPYENEGAHWIRVQRGRGVYVHAYLDTSIVEESCRRMAAAGIEEAAAPPIVD